MSDNDVTPAGASVPMSIDSSGSKSKRQAFEKASC